MARTGVEVAHVCATVLIVTTIATTFTTTTAENRASIIIFGDRLSRIRQQQPSEHFQHFSEENHPVQNNFNNQNVNGLKQNYPIYRPLNDYKFSLDSQSENVTTPENLNNSSEVKMKILSENRDEEKLVEEKNNNTDVGDLNIMKKSLRDEETLLNIEQLFEDRPISLASTRRAGDDQTTASYSVTKSVSTRVNKPVKASSDSNSNNTDLENVIEALKHRLEMSTEYFYVPERTRTTPKSVKTTNAANILVTAPATPTTSCPNCNHWNTSLMPTNEFLRQEIWTVPILVTASISMIMMVAFEIFVLCKASRTTPSRRHLFLGQMLLLGLFSCAGLSALITANPTPFTCATIRFGVGVAYALVFATLLVKCVFLISLNGGVYLPAPYQGLLLLFAVLIQVAIGTQWLLNSPPVVHVQSVPPVTARHRLLITVNDISTNPTPQTIALCQTPYVDILISLIYVICLIIFVAILAVKSRGIRDNYRESTYIGLAVGFTVPLWLLWSLTGLIVAERHRDACLATGLVITSVMVFLVMFLPKGRQLAAMGKEGVYMEDREDRFSSLSRAGSGYSPSFFHFKPMKYGVHGTTTNSHKRHPTVTTLGGDHLALYPASSGYNRMYHYYPYINGMPITNYYYSSAPHYTPASIFVRSDDGNVYTTLEPTLSSNPNVYFQRSNGLHPGMMY